eukprot:7485107-Pyramimonas_sp.AAC.1
MLPCPPPPAVAEPPASRLSAPFQRRGAGSQRSVGRCSAQLDWRPPPVARCREPHQDIALV